MDKRLHSPCARFCARRRSPPLMRPAARRLPQQYRRLRLRVCVCVSVMILCTVRVVHNKLRLDGSSRARATTTTY
eukprot:5830525-Pyramimonas_sp.AAC.1